MKHLEGEKALENDVNIIISKVKELIILNEYEEAMQKGWHI